MSKLALLAALPALAIAGSAHADPQGTFAPTAPQTVIVVSQPQSQPRAHERHGVGRRTAGIVLTVISIVDVVAGSVLTGEGWADFDVVGIIAGPTLLGESLILGIVGPTLWASGGKEAGKPPAPAAPGFQLGNGVTFQPRAAGFTLHF